MSGSVRFYELVCMLRGCHSDGWDGVEHQAASLPFNRRR